jgi:hypothetical protein
VTNSTTILTDDPMAVSINPTTCSIYLRDSNIIISGLTIIQSGPTAATALPMIMIQSANHITISNIVTADGSLTTSSSNGGKNIMLRDVFNVLVDHPTFNGWVLLQDGIDLYGPARGVTIQHIRGHSGDDFTSVSSIGGGIATNFNNPRGIQGPIDSVLVQDIVGCSMASVHGTQSFGPQGTVLPITNLTFRDMYGSPCGNANGGGFSEGILLDQGYFDNVVLDNIGGWLFGYPIQIQGITAGTISIKNVSTISSNSSPYHSGGIYVYLNKPVYTPYTPTNIQNLMIDEISATSSNSEQYFVNVDPFTTVQNLSISNVQAYGINGGAYQPFYLSGTLGTVILDSININYNSASASTCVVCVLPQTGANGSVGKLSAHKLYVTHQSGSAASGYLVYVSPFGGFSTSLGDLSLVDVSDTAPTATANVILQTASSSGPIGNYVINGLRADHISACVQLAGSSLTGVAQVVNVDATNITTPSTCTISTVLGDSGANGIVKRTAVGTTGAAASSDVIALWQSGGCSGYLKSDNTCSVPSGGGGTAYTYFTDGILGLSANVTTLANVILGRTFNLPVAIVVNDICKALHTADNTGNLYDIGISDTGGNLLVHTGAIAGTVFAPNTTTYCNAVTGSPPTLQPGTYVLEVTTNCSSACAALSANAIPASSDFWLPINVNTVGWGTTSAGLLPSSSTLPNPVFTSSAFSATTIWFGLH